MEPSKQPRNPNDLLIFQNIDDEDFEWQFDAIRTPLPYFIAAGEMRELPFYIARHGVEKLLDKILQKKGLNHMNILHRKEWRDKIVLGIKQINNMRPPTPNELALKALQRKKDSDPYEELFKEREVAAQIKAEAEVAGQQKTPPLYQTQGKAPAIQPIAPDATISAQPVVPTTTNESANQEALKVADPGRDAVYNFLTTRAHLDLSHPATRDKLDHMSVDDIKAEFGQEFPDIIDPSLTPVPDTKASLSEEGMPITAAGTPVVPPAPAQPVTQAPPVAPPPAPAPTPQIPMNPAANAAPLLDQQLQQVR